MSFKLTTDSVYEWNKIYRETSPVPAATVLQENLHLLPKPLNESDTNKLKALDIACGLAENAFLLAHQGFSVDAWGWDDCCGAPPAHHESVGIGFECSLSGICLCATLCAVSDSNRQPL